MSFTISDKCKNWTLYYNKKPLIQGVQDQKLPKEIGITKVKLMTNNPLKVKGLVDNGITVENRIEHIQGISTYNEEYLSTKAKRMGHILPFVFNE